jgi:acetamidase/formamidase
MTGTFRFIVHKRTSRLPTAQDADYYYLYGIDHDLDRAAKGAVYEVVRFLQSHKGWTAAKAYSFASLAVDFVNSELVDGTLVVEGKIPKRLL